MDLRERPERLAARHPWETARAAFFARLLRDTLDRRAPVRALDVGAGDGFAARKLLESLPPGSAIECYDANYSQALIAQLHAESPLLRFSNALPAGRFDLIVMLDVIEHVPDDRRFVAEFVRESLAPHGKVLISVPALMALFTQHDVALGHHRRYGAAELRATIRAAGLSEIASGGLFHSLLLPRFAAKLAELARGVRSGPSPELVPDRAATDLGDWRGGGLWTTLVNSALAVDNRGSRLAAAFGVQLPGLSQWALAERSSGDGG